MLEERIPVAKKYMGTNSEFARDFHLFQYNSHVVATQSFLKLVC